MIKTVALLLPLLGAFTLARAQDPAQGTHPSRSTQEPAHEEFVCRSGAEVRRVSVFNTYAGGVKPSGCRVDYTKDGATRTLWSSRSHAYCAARAASLVTKLAEGHFPCRPHAVESPDAGAQGDPAG